MSCGFELKVNNIFQLWSFLLRLSKKNDGTVVFAMICSIWKNFFYNKQNAFLSWAHIEKDI